MLALQQINLSIAIYVNKINIYYMQDTQQSEHSFTKSNSANYSILAFRKMIETLRVKNQSNSNLYSQPINSQILQQNASRNPSHNGSLQSAAISQNKQFIKSNILPETKQDQTVKFGIRDRSVGKNVTNKLQQLARTTNQLNNHTHQHNKMENHNNLVHSRTTDYQQLFRNKTTRNIQLIRLTKIQNNANTNNDKLKTHKSETKQQLTSNMQKLTSLMAMQNFQQTQTKIKAKSAVKRIKDLDQNLMMNFCKLQEQLDSSTSSNVIMDFFQDLLKHTGIQISEPFVKKFKNCVYFGESIQSQQTYEGFLYYFDNRFYYGEFMNNKKHGKGVELILKDQVIFKGFFQQGQKAGKFNVRKPNEKYSGELQKDLYQGHGKLYTKQSVYQGQFDRGQKHGYGQQYYPKTGVKMKGDFERGTFCKRSKSNACERKSDTSKQIMGVKFRSTTKDKINQFNRNNNRTTMELTQINKNNQQEQQYANNHYGGFKRSKAIFNKQAMKSYIPNANPNVGKIVENNKNLYYSFSMNPPSQVNPQSQHSSYDKRIRINKFKQINPNMDPQKEKDKQKRELTNMNSEDQALPTPCFYKK